MNIYDEMYDATASVRAHYQPYAGWLERTAPEHLLQKRREAELAFHRVGITFTVYGDEHGTERLIPFDIVPRILPAQEWQMLSRGLNQRVRALNLFLHDIYHDQHILNDGILPKTLILNNPQFRPEMLGVDLPGQIYAHIAGIDIVRANEANAALPLYYVLEDNLRVPSGVSYMLENRKMMMQLFPELFAQQRIAPVDHYAYQLLENLRALAPAGKTDPTVVLLTPGAYNSAYFEHTFLALQMGIELVEGQDLFVKDGFVWMRTIHGPRKVDVIYRRLDDDFLDPQVFRKDSMLGVAGLMEVYRNGRVTLANAVGTGVADDKAVYPYVPKMIQYYLNETPILANVPTYDCRDSEELSYVMQHLQDLVVKETHGSGGYGMLIGPASTPQQREDFRSRILAAPDKYIAQPTLALSACPTYFESGMASRHVDLRPFVLSGRSVHIVPGGLTRVALKEGSLVVNSSQGGGTKDTWVLEV
jgi:uncharacterized circularly permuted ATP-grasp superfamily protein